MADGINGLLTQLGSGGPPLIGVSCLADGADQIFARAVLNRGGSLEAVVPADEYRDGLPENARAEYDELFARAVVVHRCVHRESTAEAHMDASRVMVDGADHLIAVWDGEPARAYGGTADVVQYAREEGVPVSVVWPAGAHRD
ncbi:hypothetical protein O7626_02000 [Micromonospora sp. WMMD1102]|uniref:hypothetical protein n=1 Tax=Micromonospora sp. WMMD1102 TaxID=3016105 RepID=UPI002414E19C|nr:hypothetical protein [Micromonospora sp. WMMD1102]MDG4784714.1 hypothetical protein [Micromonospora sp. WMMD1102]